MSILVTGGRGAVARALTSLLTARGTPFRLGSRERGTPGAVHCDLSDPATFRAALSGVRSVFLYAEASAAEAFVKEAVTAGVEHVVLLSSSSVLGPDPAGNPLSAGHLAVEQALLASPLRTTLLRPGSFASNALSWSRPLKSGRPVHLPYPDSHCDPVHEADIAEAALAVLTDPALGGGAHTLTGPQSLTFAAQLEIVGSVLGRPVSFAAITPEEWKAEVTDYIPAPYADALLDFWAACDGRPVPVTDSVERLTGHPARSFETWVRDHAEAFGS
ncbi:NAD(P)H-binding protein [Streptomyces sp. NPDC029003]|uniref:NmrA family NAD(P)-binding protein n=1 Tax=Streptomyces sp. NPDC029003 TaxID=3155125 RepID=UPI003400E941